MDSGGGMSDIAHCSFNENDAYQCVLLYISKTPTIGWINDSRCSQLVERPCGGRRNTLVYTGKQVFNVKKQSRQLGERVFFTSLEKMVSALLTSYPGRLQWYVSASSADSNLKISAENFARELRDGTAYIGKCLDQVVTFAMLNMCQADLKSWISQQIAQAQWPKTDLIRRL